MALREVQMDARTQAFLDPMAISRSLEKDDLENVNCRLSGHKWTSSDFESDENEPPRAPWAHKIRHY